MLSKQHLSVFYVYIHSDPITGEVRYVGKGSGRRAYSFSHRYGHHAKWIGKLAKSELKPLVVILENNLPEKEAYTREEHYINHFRSLGVKLTNSTAGGNGVSGYKFSTEQKEKFRLNSTGRKQTPEQIAKMVATKIGKKRSANACNAISNGKKGKKLSDEHRAALSKAAKNRRKRVTK